MSVDRDESAVSTRVLVLGMAHADGSLHAAEIYDVAPAAGLSQQQVRLCLRRLVGEGRFTREGRGAAAVFLPTGPDSARLPDIELVGYAYEQDAGRMPWNGTWNLVGFNIPEAQRAARDALRHRLTFLGGALVHGGLYVSPNPWDDLVLAEAGRLGITDTLTLVRTVDLAVGGERDPQRLANRLWPLRQLGADYQQFVDRWRQSGSDSNLATPTSSLARVVRVVIEFSALIVRDPLLPPELLPHPWPGSIARELVLHAADPLAAIGPDAPAVLRLLRKSAPTP